MRKRVEDLSSYISANFSVSQAGQKLWRCLLLTSQLSIKGHLPDLGIDVQRIVCHDAHEDKRLVGICGIDAQHLAPAQDLIDLVDILQIPLRRPVRLHRLSIDEKQQGDEVKPLHRMLAGEDGADPLPAHPPVPEEAAEEAGGHGGQIVLPLFGALYQPVGAQEYYRGTHRLDHMILDITNGCGTTKADARFLSQAEIVVYTLQSEQ